MQNIPVKINPIEKDLLPDKVEDEILNYIVKNHLRTGDKIPSEREFSLKLKVGRNSVRNALLSLENRDIIVRQIGKGSFLKNSDLKKTKAKVDVRLFEVNFIDILEIRMNLEKLAIKKAVENGTEALFDELLKAGKRMSLLAKKGEYSVAADREFHSKLYDCAGSKTLKQLILNLIDSLDYYQCIYVNPDEHWILTIPYHLDIAYACKERNLALALAAQEYIYNHDLKVLSSKIRG
ncbi:FCD domain-containing protein [Treponema sp. HNW]|uniref:FadR/GntR family transcriptional regulator n=1 Tax=Treponema sp. HNW TaxID=3116654 RepID=UPI003D0EF522